MERHVGRTRVEENGGRIAVASKRFSRPKSQLPRIPHVYSPARFRNARHRRATLQTVRLRGPPFRALFLSQRRHARLLQFRELHDEFKKAGFAVFGVSRDTVASHEKFKKKMSFPFELLSDPDETVCNIFGVMKMKNMYGKKVRGIERSTFVIGKDGAIAKEWRGVKVPGHAQEVLDAAKALV
jgi:peroxiredoxin Q/BCP